MTKIAVCFFGITRSLKHTIGSIEQNILTPARAAGEVKVYAHFFQQSEILNSRTGETGTLDTEEHALLPTDWLELEEPDLCLQQWDFETLKSFGDFWKNDFQSLRNLVHQTHSLRKTALAALDDGADVCLFCRPDLLYHDTLAAPIKRAVAASAPLAQTPLWQSWTGLNDRFALCTGAEAIAAYGTRIERAHAFCAAGPQPLHSERLVSYALSDIPVKTISTRASRVRANGVQKKEEFLPPRLAAVKRYGVNSIRTLLGRTT